MLPKGGANRWQPRSFASRRDPWFLIRKSRVFAERGPARCRILSSPSRNQRWNTVSPSPDAGFACSRRRDRRGCAPAADRVLAVCRHVDQMAADAARNQSGRQALRMVNNNLGSDSSGPRNPARYAGLPAATPRILKLEPLSGTAAPSIECLGGSAWRLTPAPTPQRNSTKQGERKPVPTRARRFTVPPARFHVERAT